MTGIFDHYGLGAKPDGQTVVQAVATTASREGDFNQAGQALVVASQVDYVQGNNPAALVSTQRNRLDMAPLVWLGEHAPPMLASLARAQLLAGSDIRRVMKGLTKAVGSMRQPAAVPNPIKALLRMRSP